jgi:hypothetical protein
MCEHVVKAAWREIHTRPCSEKGVDLPDSVALSKLFSLSQLVTSSIKWGL